MRPSWQDVYLAFAWNLSRRSTCARLNVGTVVVSDDMNRVLAIGYNGNYAGGPNRCDADEPGNCGCVHSELNALLKLDYNDPTRKRMFVTHSPCVPCSKAIVNAGIAEVLFCDEYRDVRGLEILTIAGIYIARVTSDLIP